MTDWSQYAQNWATGMTHAEPKMAAMRRAQQAVSVHNRQRGTCPIKGCKNTSHRGGLCAKHLKLVPYRDKITLRVELMQAQSRITTRHHKRWARELAARMRSAPDLPAARRHVAA